MKKSLIVIATVFLGLSAFAADAATDREVQVGVNAVYVPGSFDSNSEAYVVVSGVFQNGCYKWARADINHIDTFNHEVKSIASVTQGMCIMVLVPFQNDVRLGKLASGQHTLRFMSGDGTYLEKTLKIE